jgi:hypothetical protein
MGSIPYFAEDPPVFFARRGLHTLDGGMKEKGEEKEL